MKQSVKTISSFLLGMGALAVASVSSAQTFVRYSQDGGEVSWGMVHDDGIYQLAGAPYDTMDLPVLSCNVKM